MAQQASPALDQLTSQADERARALGLTDCVSDDGSDGGSATTTTP